MMMMQKGAAGTTANAVVPHRQQRKWSPSASASSSSSYCCRFGSTNMNLATFLLFLVVLLLVFALQHCTTDAAARPRVYRVTSNSPPKLHNQTTRKCLVERDPQMHIVADQICELCHEMFSHEQPNLRADCSAHCYRNAKFRKCLDIYSALPEGHPGGAIPEGRATKRNDDSAGMEPTQEEQWVLMMIKHPRYY